MQIYIYIIYFYLYLRNLISCHKIIYGTSIHLNSDSDLRTVVSLIKLLKILLHTSSFTPDSRTNLLFFAFIVMKDFALFGAPYICCGHLSLSRNQLGKKT